MANKESNFPPNQVNKLSSSLVGEVVTSLNELSQMGKPQNADELKERVQAYFEYCQMKEYIPGIESLSLALGVSRVTFWKWCHGQGVPSVEFQEECIVAKQFILSFLEQMALKGKLNPATHIFLLKNIGGYVDTMTVDQARNDVDYDEKNRKALSIECLPTLDAFNKFMKDNEQKEERED